MENIIIPVEIELPPIPIRLPNTIIGMYGLPNGLTYDPSQNVIKGTPHLVGHYGVLIAMDNVEKPMGFTVTVVEFRSVPIQLCQLTNLTCQLGQPITPIIVTQNETSGCHDSSIKISVSGLPPGIEYDPFFDHIAGTPEVSGTYKVVIRATNKYGTELIKKILVEIDGQRLPSIDLCTTMVEQLSDMVNSFHSIGDQLKYTFTVKNTGNVPLTHICVDDTKLGRFDSKITLPPGSQTSIECAYQLTLSDLDDNLIHLHTIACGDTMDGTRLTTMPFLHETIIRGHDKSIHIKIIKNNYDDKTKLIKYTLMFTNQGEKHINAIKINNTLKYPMQQEMTCLPPGGLSLAHVTIPSKYTDILVNMVGLTDCGVVGQSYRMVMLNDHKSHVFIKAYTNHHHINELQPVSLIAKITSDSQDHITGCVKFYDGLKCVGKSNIRNGLASISLNTLEKGCHLIYVSYQGDKTHYTNGSDIFRQYVGPLDDEQSSYIKTHAEKIKKNEAIAATLRGL
jgi:hypothetical protein